MKRLREAPSIEVMEYWAAEGRFWSSELRGDVRDELPEGLQWTEAEIEPADMVELFCPASSDWVEITQGTFLIAAAAGGVDAETGNAQTVGIADEVRGMQRWLQQFPAESVRLVAITPFLELSRGFTVIEGARWAVAMAREFKLVGAKIFIGASPEVRNCGWASAAIRRHITRSPASHFERETG